MIQRSERFTKAYDSLIRAFFEGTLAKGSCIGCACGNIIFDAVGEHLTADLLKRDLTPSIVLMGDRELWGMVRRKRRRARELWTCYRTITSIRPFETQAEGSKDRVNEAGYTTGEFMKIEEAFENACQINISQYEYHSEQTILEDQYKGLCAVVDVLLELEGEQPGGDELKAKFREHPKLAVV